MLNIFKKIYLNNNITVESVLWGLQSHKFNIWAFVHKNVIKTTFFLKKCIFLVLIKNLNFHLKWLRTHSALKLISGDSNKCLPVLLSMPDFNYEKFVILF